MPRSPKSPEPGIPRPESPDSDAPELVEAATTPVAAAAFGSLADLPVAGLTRRRVALMLGALVVAWVIVLFARQVGEASEATARAEAMRTANAQLETDVTALEQELTLIGRQAFISQAAREYRLGTPQEIPFTLAEDAPPLPDDAPGSAAVRLGTVVERPRPIDSWAHLLFGDASD
jgi:cell division protein FtsB